VDLLALIREISGLAPGTIARAGHALLVEEGHAPAPAATASSTRIIAAGADVSAETQEFAPGDILKRTVHILAIRSGKAPELTLGRDPRCQVRIEHSSVSRRHVRFARPAPGKWTVEDLDSTNGTFLEGERLEKDRPLPVASGAVVRVGPELRLTFFEGEALEHFVRDLERLASGPLGVRRDAGGRKVARLPELPSFLHDSTDGEKPSPPPAPEPEPPPLDATRKIPRAELQRAAAAPSAPAATGSEPPLRLEVEGFPPVPLATGKPVFCGREPGKGFHLPHEHVSRQHALFERRGEEVLVVDLGSRNGVWKDGQRVARVALRPGEEVTLGPFVVRVRRG
jgi:pSer/pThr/pTyr-binding forkhead associated (FHA) protein